MHWCSRTVYAPLLLYCFLTPDALFHAVVLWYVHWNCAARWILQHQMRMIYDRPTTTSVHTAVNGTKTAEEMRYRYSRCAYAVWLVHYCTKLTVLNTAEKMSCCCRSAVCTISLSYRSHAVLCVWCVLVASTVPFTLAAWLVMIFVSSCRWWWGVECCLYYY